jgi:hypothetical protein
MTYACPAWEFAAEIHLLKLQRLQNKVLCTIDNFPKAHIGSRYACSFQCSVRLRLHNVMQKTSRDLHNHESENVHNIGQGETPQKKNKRLKLGGGHLYDYSSV